MAPCSNPAKGEQNMLKYNAYIENYIFMDRYTLWWTFFSEDRPIRKDGITFSPWKQIYVKQFLAFHSKLRKICLCVYNKTQ